MDLSGRLDQTNMLICFGRNFFVRKASTILYKTRWDICSTNHHYVHNQDYMYKCMIQYPCSKHASSPPSPTKQCWYTYTCLLFICSTLSLTTLILGSGEQSFYHNMSQQFRTRLTQQLIVWMYSGLFWIRDCLNVF